MVVDEAKFKQTFLEVFRIPEDKYTDKMKMGDIFQWDSITQFELVCALEEAFGIVINGDEMESADSIVKLKKLIEGK